MSSPGLPVLAWGRPVAARAVAAALGLVALLYLWPAVDGATGSSFSDVDRLLQLAAATALGVAASVASWRTEGRDRHALVALAAGAEASACAQAAHLGLDLVRPDLVGQWLDAVAASVLTAGLVAALWLLREPRPPRRSGRVALEWALLAVSATVLLLVVPAATDGPSAALRAVAAALLGAAALLTALRRRSLRRAWPLLAVTLAVAAAGLALDVVVGTGAAVLDRLAGALLTGGLAAAAVAVLAGGHAEARDPEPAPGRTAPALVLCVASVLALGAVGVVVLTGGSPPVVALAGAGLVVLLGYVRLHLLAAESRAQARALADAEVGLRHQAFHDELTGLANRALFVDRLGRALDVHRRHRLGLSVVYGDLDGFKLVNDVHGHAAGDELLVAVAERLRACLRPEDTLARLGGDEFVLLLEHTSSPHVVDARLREALQEPFVTSAGTFRLSMSTGIAEIGPEDPTPSGPQLLARADSLMYAAKQRARAARSGRTVPAQDRAPQRAPVPAAPAHPPASTAPPSEASLAAALAAALHQGEVQVVYQPVVDARTGGVQGLEALARWSHGGRSVPPAQFVDLAERFGLGGTLTDVVLEQACAQLRTWTDAVGHSRLSMAVNVSPGQLADPTLPTRVRGALERHRLEPGQLVLDTTVDALDARRHGLDGLPLSVSGFTGGASDFALLSSVPVRSVKVDGRPADGAGALEGERLLRMLAALGRELDVRVVVERVERPQELERARLLSGVLAQGNLLSQPAPADVLDDVVRHGCPLPL